LSLSRSPQGLSILASIRPSKSSADAGALKLQDLLALSCDLDAHVLDFGANVFYPHSAPSTLSGLFGKPLGAPPDLVVKAKPPEQDLDFTGSFHEPIVQIVNDLASR
jgi:hypothetical protein